MIHLHLKNLLIQIILLGCLFFGLTGAGFLIGWESLKHYRTLHQFLSPGAIFLGVAITRYRFLKDPKTFLALEPIHSIKYFLELPASLSVSILVVVYFLTQFSSQILMHAGLETVLWDFGFYDQVLWNTAHGHILISSIQGGVHVFSAHIKPMLVLLAPIYQVSNNTTLLFAITTLIISSSVGAVYLIAHNLTRSHITALVFALCAFFYLPLRNGINYPFHTQTLADPLILFGFYFILKRWSKSALICLFLALMCKENIVLDILGIGLFLISKREKMGWSISAIALVWLASLIFIIEPHFKNPYAFWNKWGFYSHFFTPKLELWLRLLHPNPVAFLFLLFGPLLFLSFNCKGWYWLLGPSLAIRLLSAMEEFRMTTTHRSAGLNALVFISAAYGIASFLNHGHKLINPRWFYFIKSKNGLMVSLILAAVLFSGTPQLLSIDRYLMEASKPEYQRIVRILDSIPEQFSVLASESLCAHLAHRPFLYTFLNVFKNSPLEEASKHPDFVITDDPKLDSRQRKVMDEFIQQGYRSIFKLDFMKIYEHPTKKPVFSAELIYKWEEFKKSPTIPYRSIIRFWYQQILLVASFLFFILLIIRSSQVGKKVRQFKQKQFVL